MSDVPAILEIGLNEDGEIQTIFRPGLFVHGVDVIQIGMMLASATRVITEVFIRELKLPEVQREQIESAIAEIYSQDLGHGDCGEMENTEIL